VICTYCKYATMGQA